MPNPFGLRSPDRAILSTNQQIRGLIVLLVSKAFSVPKHVSDNYDNDSETNRMANISKNQRKLAEIADMIHLSQSIHKGIVDVAKDDSRLDLKQKEDLSLGNTISVLVGDYIFAQACWRLALIRCPTVTGLVSKAICNHSEGQFLWQELLQTPDQRSDHSLEQYCYLSEGSLLGHSCQSAILLAEYDSRRQENAFLIGKYIGIALHVSPDLRMTSTLISLF